MASESRQGNVKSYSVGYQARPRSSSQRRHSLTRQRSSQRLIRTISIESGVSNNTDDDDLRAANEGVADLELDVSETANKGPRRVSSTDAIDNLGSTPSEYIEIPFVKETLDASLPLDYLKQDVLNLIQCLKISKWYNNKKVQPAAQGIKLIKMSGAMTNAIFKVEYPKLPSLLLRIYGPNIDNIIDREYELQILARLSLKNIGPSLYGCFVNGRFEQFLEDSKTLTKDDIRNWKSSQRIARRMKELHVGVPLLNSERKNGSACWQKIEQWLHTIENVDQWVENPGNLDKSLLCKDWSKFKHIVHKYHKWLIEQEHGIDQVNKNLVFCHNDAQYGNLLFTVPVMNTSSLYTAPSSTSLASQSSSLFPSDSNVIVDDIINPPKQEQSQDSKLVVIDFEYAGANPAAYDLANHLSEWMYDYNDSKAPHKCHTDGYPDKEQVLNFLYSYVSHLRGGAKEHIDEEVQRLYKSIIQWRPTVQLFWSLWAILQSGELEKKDALATAREEIGPNGKKYIIKTVLDSPEEDLAENEDEPEAGVSIDTFDYMAYGRDKIAVFWGDLIGLGIITEKDCENSSSFKFLDTGYL
ncbi:cki1p [Saccharomyces arboricola H-6]|uniref:Cki1p n=1 Tax=Saccharomyces arboricola (strain H-6 / AS 2.3317 / CBS 10644) TaxID=1160507 RepID=J8LKY8_SACAR|nr:cki1p [Saccharomyces arboricola H-6]